MASLHETLPASSNWTRFDAYYRMARMFFDGNQFPPIEMATMLHDLLWDEIPAAFAVALDRAARAGPLRPNIGASFGRLVKLSVYLAFGDIDPTVVPHYWRRNWEFFFTSCVEQLLRSNARIAVEGEPELTRALKALLEMLEPVREYTTVPSASPSGVHALLHMSSIGRPNFLEHGGCSSFAGVADPSLSAYRQPLSRAHCVLANFVATAVLDEPKRDITTWTNAFGFFAGCARWRGFFEKVRGFVLFDSQRCNNVNILVQLTSKRLNQLRTGTLSPTGDDDAARPSTPTAPSGKTPKREYETPERVAPTAKRRRTKPE